MAGLTAILSIAGLIFERVEKKKRRDNGDKNPFEGKHVRFVEDESDPINADGVCGHLEIVGVPTPAPAGFYERVVKRLLDVVLSSAGLVVLSPVLAVISLMVWSDDPGPILFTQKRIGINKSYFRLHKFRSMKMSTPHDVPTHALSNPESYITKVGRVLRKTSGDELLQLINIWKGDMSVIGPRPALWNQDLLVSEREKVDANSAKPGLTGLAQIKGRDELEIVDKAELDGEYVRELRAGGIRAFIMDCKCFFGTIVSILHHDGIVEGGTGSIEKHS